MKNMLILLAVLSGIMLVISIAVTVSKPFSRRRGVFGPGMAVFTYLATLVQIAVVVFCFWIYASVDSEVIPAGPGDVILDQNDPDVPTGGDLTTPVETETTVPPTEDLRLNFQPVGSQVSNPDNFEIEWEIIVNDEIVESYSREDPICFELDSKYFALPGIATFRGNNYRNNASYGTAVVEKEAMATVWKHGIGTYNKWGGCAWTGQPLVVQWDEETKAIMETMYDSKKAKEGLVEMIYATLDGNIHFYDMEDGSQTRDPIFMGMNFKGAGALDPRGYPLLYVGSGLKNGSKQPRMFVVSLIDGSILYEYGNNDEFAERNWTAYDSSPLVDAESDTLIWPGESGLLYTIKLNTKYDKEAGTISVSPDTPVKTRYRSWYSEEDDRYLGYEASVTVVDHYLFTSENGGLFQCIDLNTMELIWAQDTKDDSNSSPLFEWGEDGNGYIYTAPSLHWTAENHEGTVSIYKLDATTGEIVWEHATKCVRYDDIAGGVQSSPLIGKEGTDIEGLIIYSISRTPSAYRGVLTALDKETGEVVWEVSTGNYAWSSPVALYTEDGRAYIFLCNASGIARLIDGSTGETLDTLDFDQTCEASPVVFNNMLVIGTREGVYGLKIS